MRFLLLLLLPFATPAQVLQVTLLDQANVPVETLEGAREVLAGIYRQAGIQVQVTVKKSSWQPGQVTQWDDLPGDIIVRICSEQMAKILVPKASIFGYVQPVGPGVLPRVANVFYYRVQELKAAIGSPVPEVLGTALAHELGHLLIGRGAHAPTGIMRCPWDAAEMRELRRGQLQFDRRQAKAILESVRTRRALSLSTE